MITTLPGAIDMKPGSAAKPLLRHRRSWSTEGAELDGAASWQPLHRRAPGPARCAPSTATTSGSCRPISRSIAAATSPATAAAATKTAITGSPAGSTTCSTSPATGSAPPRSRARWSSHASVAEAAVVGYPHDIKGQGIYAYVTLVVGVEPSAGLEQALRQQVRSEIGPIATPDLIHLTPGSAEDALRQDHAPHPAQDRRERIWRARRHLDPGRPVAGRRPHRRATSDWRTQPGLEAVVTGWIVAADIGGTQRGSRSPTSSPASGRASA